MGSTISNDEDDKLPSVYRKRTPLRKLSTPLLGYPHSAPRTNLIRIVAGEQEQMHYHGKGQPAQQGFRFGGDGRDLTIKWKDTRHGGKAPDTRAPISGQRFKKNTLW